MIDIALQPRIQPRRHPTGQGVRRAVRIQRQPARVRVSEAMVRSAGVEAAA